MPVSKVDLDKCIGCGTCVESCPMDVFRLDTVVEYRVESSPCSLACPLGLRQREYHDLLKLGMLDEAAEILRQCHPMPAITGRLCPHPCESECTRGTVDEAVNINALEQFLGDHLLGRARAAVPATATNVAVGSGEPAGVVASGRPARVAIVGSGPAGLAAAYFLVLGGFGAVVFEKDEKLGGLLRTAIPAFRLPEDVLDTQIDFYRTMGIGFRTGIRVGIDLSVQDLRKQGFAAVIGATGAARPVGLSVPGCSAAGIVGAMEFLAQAKLAGPRLSGTVAVVGGGSVALDAARTAVRLGAERVSVICLERLEPGLKDSMPALKAEIEDGLAEGIEIHPSRGVDSFDTIDGRVSAVRCVECLSVRDEDGRFNPVYGDCVLPGVIEAETVILAIGQIADAALVPAGFVTDAMGLISVDAAGLRTAGLWAAGDAVSGASTVVEALASGKRAAEVVAHYLRGEELDVESIGEAIVAAAPPEEKVEQIPRTERRCRPGDERRRDFGETWLAFDGLQARAEAERCLTCGSRSKIAYLDDCQVCRLCQKYCPTDAIEITEGALLGSLHGWNVVELGR